MRCGWLWVSLLLLWLGTAAQAQERLIFCNEPERIRDAGTYADARVEADCNYTVFYHYRNVSGDNGEFVIQLRSIDEEPFTITTRQGLADPNDDPPLVGRQAMARFLRAPERPLIAPRGITRFTFPLGNRQVASGVLSLRSSKNLRLRIFFKHDKWDAPRMRTVVLNSPRCEVDIPLTANRANQSYRIGMPERGPDNNRLRNGAYGMVYAFRIAAPEGRRVRICFTPRGGKAGLVGILGGDLVVSDILPAFERSVFKEAVVGPGGLTLTTSPFGGVFYPVEVTFQLL